MIRRAKEVLKIEAEAISSLIKRVDKNFEKAIGLILTCKGKVVVTGMGKPGIIGEKISATLSSTGTPSLSLHPADAIHGDLGSVTKDDVVIAISNSGETEEISTLLPMLRKIGAKIIAMTGNLKSTLAKHSDVILNVGVKKEACPFGLAPTASTTAMLAMGDALAIALLEKKGFKVEDFAFYHPGGALGKRLILKVEDIMRSGKANPVVKEYLKVKDVLLKITEARAGSASVVNKKGVLTGIFTDGDLRRHLEEDLNLPNRKVKEVMTKKPTTITKDRLAADAFRILREKKVDEIPVVDEKERPIGLVDVQDLLKAGLV
ncbi:MAG: hypothetical protein AMJ78_06635 [Omnitrophica WOR_2 bacterium SM23_29]|nr:MAG: hypothetical protein AMJ78_06635 [Omnitrophica WOR_2 bacterium SM23_29]